MNVVLVPVSEPVYTNTQQYTDFWHIPSNWFYRTDADYMEGQTNSIAFHDGEEVPLVMFAWRGVKQMMWWNLASILSVWTMDWSFHGFQGQDVCHGGGPTATAAFGSYAAVGKSAVKLANKNVRNVWQYAGAKMRQEK